MSKEISQINIQIKPSDEGLILVTSREHQKTEIFDSIEDSILEKDREATLKKSSAAILFSLGIAGLFSAGLAWDKEGLEGYAGGSFYLSFGLLYASTKLHDSGDFAREQWRKLKEIAGQKSEANNTQLVPN